jgi:ribonuclease D
MTLISTTADLAAFCDRQSGADFVALDTEFMRDTTYWPKLCLVQVGGPEEAVAIDTLAKGIDLAPFYRMLADESLLKVLHSARQDLEIFFHETGKLPKPIFDSQVAAMVCGFGESVAYQTLARELAGAKIDKTSRFADWSHRPLTQRQIDYALADVIHLRPIYRKLKRKLRHNGREAWLGQEMDILTDPATYRLTPEHAWRRLKPRSHDRRFLAVVRSVAAWREEEAQRRDVPRNRVLRDEQLMDIAAHRPKGAEQLGRTRGLSLDFAQGRLGQGILAAVQEGLAVPDDERPKPVRRAELNGDPGPMPRAPCGPEAGRQHRRLGAAGARRRGADPRPAGLAAGHFRRGRLGPEARRARPWRRRQGDRRDRPGAERGAEEIGRLLMARSTAVERTPYVERTSYSVPG